MLKGVLYLEGSRPFYGELRTQSHRNGDKRLSKMPHIDTKNKKVCRLRSFLLLPDAEEHLCCRFLRAILQFKSLERRRQSSRTMALTTTLRGRTNVRECYYNTLQHRQGYATATREVPRPLSPANDTLKISYLQNGILE